MGIEPNLRPGNADIVVKDSCEGPKSNVRTLGSFKKEGVVSSGHSSVLSRPFEEASGWLT